MYFDTWLGFSELSITQMLEENCFEMIDTTIVDKEDEPPHFQTLLATARKPRN